MIESEDDKAKRLFPNLTSWKVVTLGGMPFGSLAMQCPRCGCLLVRETEAIQAHIAFHMTIEP